MGSAGYSPNGMGCARLSAIRIVVGMPCDAAHLLLSLRVTGLDKVYPELSRRMSGTSAALLQCVWASVPIYGMA